MCHPLILRVASTRCVYVAVGWYPKSLWTVLLLPGVCSRDVLPTNCVICLDFPMESTHPKSRSALRYSSLFVCPTLRCWRLTVPDLHCQSLRCLRSLRDRSFWYDSFEQARRKVNDYITNLCSSPGYVTWLVCCQGGFIVLAIGWREESRTAEESRFCFA